MRQNLLNVTMLRFEGICYILICYNIIYSEYVEYKLICIFVNISPNLVMYILNNCTKSIV